MDKVICIQDGFNNYHPDRAHISRGEIFHVIDVRPHTSFEEAATCNAAPGDWYQLAEVPFYHWSGLFKKLEYDETLEELEQVYNGK